MLTVIIDARTRAAPLPVLLSQLTAGAVEGLVRQVLILAAPDQPGIAEICEDMGAEAHPAFGEAAKAARAEWLMVLSADFRLRDGWIGALSDHLARGKREAAMVGLCRPTGTAESDRGWPGAAAEVLAQPFGLGVERGAGLHQGEGSGARGGQIGDRNCGIHGRGKVLSPVPVRGVRSTIMRPCSRPGYEPACSPPENHRRRR